MSERALTVRLDAATHDKLRERAFALRVPMADIIRTALVNELTPTCAVCSPEDGSTWWECGRCRTEQGRTVGE